MRTCIALVIALLCSVAAPAETTDHFQITVFGSDIGGSRNHNKGESWSGGAGIALAYAWSPRWSLDLAAASENHRLLLTRFVPLVINGQTVFAPPTFLEFHRTYPIDLTARYSFPGTDRWRPFAAVGFHHVSAPNTHPSSIQIPVIPRAPGDPKTVHEGSFSDANDAELIAGVDFRITQRLHVEGGVRRLVANSRQKDAFDPLTRAVVGLSWSF
jgi:Outer membrane protein beta-barrel domain